MKMFKWIVEFQVADTWVADGFQMTDQRAWDMLSKDLSYADMDTEIHARVVASPNASLIAKAQGYENNHAVEKVYVDGLLVHQEDNQLENIRRVIMHAYRQLDSVAFLTKEGDTEGIKADLLHAAGQIANGFNE